MLIAKKQTFFETGALANPTKLQNPTVLGLGVLASTQWSHTSRFCHWRPSFGYNDYPPFKTGIYLPMEDCLEAHAGFFRSLMKGIFNRDLFTKS